MFALKARSIHICVSFALLCCCPSAIIGQQHTNTAVKDHCTDLERNEVPCPPSENNVVPTITSNPSPTGEEGRFFPDDEARTRRAADMGSTNVPPDSWVYLAFDRLGALGYVHSAFADLRPWTRMECARILQEADEGRIDAQLPSEASGIYRALRAEFETELSLIDGGTNRGVQMETVYTRMTGISDPAMNQSYYFGQTLINDFGRPYAEGLNVISGISARAALGPFSIYVNGEYQHSPSAPGLPTSASQAIATDFWHEPAPPVTPSSQIDHLRLIDAYVAFQKSNWQFSFGRQSLWWGPGASGPLLYSDNAKPITMARISQVSPTRLPWILGWLGPMRSEFFVGRLSGQHFVNLGTSTSGSWNAPLGNQPFLHGEKVSFKPTANLEFGVSRTGVFGGPGFPITFSRLANVLFSTGNSFGPHDPGDRRSGFDFVYRIPHLRNRLILYNDSITEDEMSPIGYPRRAAMSPGIYMPRIPWVPKLDFRAEAAYTDLPGLRYQGFYYYNVRYVDGYTNQGNILGSWVGRDGKGLQLSTTYWFSPHDSMRFEYRGQRVDKAFLQGGSLDGFTMKSDLLLHSGLSLSTSVQYQRWRFPVLAHGTQSLFVSTVQLTYWPKRQKAKGSKEDAMAESAYGQ